MPVAEFRVPPLVVTGPGSSERVAEIVDRLGIEGVAVVTDRNLSATVKPVIERLGSAGQLRAVYDAVTTEPTTGHVDDLIGEMQRTDAGGLVAIGGGSAIDTGKAAAAAMENPGPLFGYQGYDLFTEASRPLIAVPTTGGTGSEATRVAVITDSEREVKMLMVADQLLPTAAVVDPVLTVSCPPRVTASSGVDALSHAIEAYVSKRRQPLTNVLALSACEAVAGFLRAAYRDGEDLEARSRVLQGALEAGMAFSNASVALVHGMSRPLGAVFGIPHGIANAMLLPAVMRFSLEGAVPRYAELAEAMGVAAASMSDEARAERAVSGVESLVADLGIPTLGGYGLNRDEFESTLSKMAKDALESGSPAYNPRVPTKSEIVDLYLQCY